MFPGTIFWKEKIDTPQKLKKFQAQLVAAGLDKRFFNRASAFKQNPDTSPADSKWIKVEKNQRAVDKPVEGVSPSLRDVASAVNTKEREKGTTGPTKWRVYDELYAFLAGREWTPYRKQWDYQETRIAPPSEQAYVPGCSSATAEIGGFEFGFEICYDHENHALQYRGKEVDFHILVSDSIKPTTGHMVMKEGWYFLSASSDNNRTGVRRKSKGKRVAQPPLPANIQSGQLTMWLVDIEQAVASHAVAA